MVPCYDLQILTAFPCFDFTTLTHDHKINPRRFNPGSKFPQNKLSIESCVILSIEHDCHDDRWREVVNDGVFFNSKP